MTTTSAIEFGLLQFMPVETFNDPLRGLDKESRREKEVENILEDLLYNGSPKPPNGGDWFRIHTAIRRADEFVVETSSPTFTVRLRFCPEKPMMGDYEIHYRPRGPRGRIERGRTDKVTAVHAGETDARMAYDRRFANRLANILRQHGVKVWYSRTHSRGTAMAARDRKSPPAL